MRGGCLLVMGVACQGLGWVGFKAGDEAAADGRCANRRHHPRHTIEPTAVASSQWSSFAPILKQSPHQRAEQSRIEATTTDNWPPLNGPSRQEAWLREGSRARTEPTMEARQSADACVQRYQGWGSCVGRQRSGARLNHPQPRARAPPQNSRAAAASPRSG